MVQICRFDEHCLSFEKDYKVSNITIPAITNSRSCRQMFKFKPRGFQANQTFLRSTKMRPWELKPPQDLKAQHLKTSDSQIHP